MTDLTLERLTPVNWQHNPLPVSVTVADSSIVEISNTDISSGAQYRLTGLIVGETILTLNYENPTRSRTLTIGVVARLPETTQDPLSSKLPRITISGPSTLTAGDIVEYEAQTEGGDYESIEQFQWSCGAQGSGSTALVDARNRQEGLIQVCCTVRVNVLNSEGVLVTKDTTGSAQIMVEEPD